jgi:hypothetical protein
LCWFILRQCFHVVFPSHSFLVEHELHVLITMEFHVLTHLELLFLLVHKFVAIVFASFDIWMFWGGIDTFTLVINYLNKIWTWYKHIIIGLFEVHEKQPCHGFATLIFARKKWVNLSCEIAFVKYENNNLGTMVIV